MELSNLQKAIIDSVKSNKQNILVNAIAGSGKTSTIVECIKELSNDGKKCLYLAFNSAIKNEVSSKLKGLNVDVKTINSFGFGLLKKHIGNAPSNAIAKYGGKLKCGVVDSFFMQTARTTTTFKEIQKYANDTGDKTIVMSVLGLLGAIDSSLNLSKCLGTFHKLTKENILAFITEYVDSPYSRVNKDKASQYYDFAISVALEYIKKTTKFVKKGNSLELPSSHYGLYSFPIVDKKTKKTKGFAKTYGLKLTFADQVYLPNIMSEQGISFADGNYDYIFLDECQDINASSFNFITKYCKDNDINFCAVGDVKQAIYGFAGANTKSYEMFKQVAVELPLTINYRCPRLAKHIVAEVDSGMVFDTFKSEFGVLNPKSNFENLKGFDTDLIISRKNKSCFSAFIEIINLFKEGKTQIVPHLDARDFSKEMEFIDSYANISIDKFVSIIASELSTLQAKNPKADVTKMPRGEFLTLCETMVLAFVGSDNSKTTLVGDVKKKIDVAFDSNHENKVSIITAHKSKGMERKNVFIYNSSEFPNECDNEELFAQELNLWYVAVTRFENELHFVGDTGDYSAKLNNEWFEQTRRNTLINDIDNF